MAPRMKLPTRSKGKSVVSFNHHRFPSREAEERYREYYSTKPLIPERGFELKGKVLELVGEEIERRQWAEWATQPIKAKVELAREFYANLEEAKMDKVWLLGRWVSFTPEAINRALGIPNEENHQLYTGMRIDELAEVLCPEGTEWATRNGRFCHFPKRDMTLEAQAWLYFVCARLIPAKHYTEVTTDRCRVLYAITAGLNINVGKIIYNEIIKVTPQKKTLPFPTVITLLSMAAGPEEGYDEPTYLDCLPPITERTLARISVTITREQQHASRDEEKKRPIQILQEEVAKLKEQVEKHKRYNLAMWKLWAKKNNIPEEELPEYEGSEEEEEESEEEAPSSDTD